MAGGLNIAVDHDDFYDTIKAFRSFPAEIKREVARNGKHLAEPLAKEIKAAGKRDPTRHAQRVADTVTAGMKGGVPSVTAGGLPYTMGSEWGGRHRYRVVNQPVFGRAPLRPYRRHTTMQFREHIGTTGYWFSPAIRSSKSATVVLEAWRDLVDDVIRDF